MSTIGASEQDIQTILIVDDTPANLALVVECLEDRGFRVAIAQDGEKDCGGPSWCGRLILLDVVMPRLDGFETCRRLKSLPATRDIPVIFMTSLAETGDKLAGFSSGGVDYVTKPLQVDEVLAREHAPEPARHAKAAGSPERPAAAGDPGAHAGGKRR